MTHQIRLWEVTTENTLTEVPRDEIDLEKRLQNWLAADISMLDPDLLVIGREVPTEFDGKIDLLCLDSSGGLVVVELKKGRTPRDVTAQVLDYACWVRDLSHDDVLALSDRHRIAVPLKEAFAQKFGEELPDTLNESHRSLIVAEHMDDSTERIVRYLADLDVPINVATVQHFRSRDGRQMLAQILLIEPETAVDTAHKAAAKAKHLTVRESFAFAEKQGVGELYREVRNAASGTLLTTSFGRARVGLRARVEDGIRTIMVMDIGYSDQASGLRFRLNATRLMKYFGLNEQSILDGLPEGVETMPASEWRGSSTDNVENWKGFKGCFRDIMEIRTFMALLKPSPQNANV